MLTDFDGGRVETFRRSNHTSHTSRVEVFVGPGPPGSPRVPPDTRAYEDFDPACVGRVRVLHATCKNTVIGYPAPQWVGKSFVEST